MSLNFKKINIEKCEKFPKDKVNIPSLIEDLEFIKVKRPFLYEELLNLKDENNKPYDLNDNSKENVANIQQRYFVVKAYEYLEKRFVENNISDEAKPYYLDRFEFELKTINSMKFDGYTLLVNDFLRTLNVKLGGLIGPGRGSSAGSLVSWAYGITNVDPMLDYKNTSSHLLFERYLNPERISLPDIDMDMNGLINKNDLILKLENESNLDETIKTFLNIIKEKYPNEDFLEGKGLIEDYQISLYGNDKVAKIVTRDTYQAKSSIAAVCRYLGNDFANEAGFKYKGTPYIELANKISGSAFTKPGVKFNDIFDVNSKFYNQYFINMYDSNYHVRTIVDLAKKLEGTIANYGVHAAGVLILDPKNNYTNDGYMVIGGTNVSVFDGKYVEDYINIKFDFLGLASLEEIDKTLKFIEKRYGKEKRDEVFKIINNENLLYNDKDIFRKVFDIQNTKKIFQFSSDGMQDLVKRIEPDNFDELVAITALYRPGPMESGMVDMYIKNKFNKDLIFYPFKELENVLEPTHGTCLVGDTLITTKNGKNKTIKEIVDNNEVGLKVATINESNNKIEYKKITRTYNNGFKNVFKVKTKNGFEIEATENHKFFTNRGWLELSNLTKEDFLILPKKDNVNNKKSFNKDKLLILSYLLADGYLSKSAITFVNKDIILLNNFKNAINNVFPNISIKEYKREREVYNLLCTTKDRTTYHSNELINWFKELNLFYKRSHEKFIPDFVFDLSKEDILYFLAKYWECDGHVSRNACHIKTISKDICFSLQKLLLKVDIISSIDIRPYENEKRENQVAYGIFISSFDFKKINKYINSKKGEFVIPFSSNQIKAPINIEFIVKYIKTKMHEQNITNEIFVKKTGVSASLFTLSDRTKKRNITFNTLIKINELLKDDFINKIINSDIYFTPIKEIINLNKKVEVYDIEVEDNHNFFANNILVHNCVYQEQVMKIVQVLGGFSLGGADLVRRAMGKKIKEELDNLKGQFIEGALKKYEGRHLTLNNLEQFAISQELILYYNGQDIEFKTVKEMNDLNLGEQFSEKEFGRLIIKKGEKLNISEDYITRLLANNLFENIIKFAGYGFNKSHAYAYTNVSMQMAYLKAHYPLEFFASIFVNNSDDIEKLTEYIVDGKKNGIIIYGVDINKSNLEFDTIDNKAIIYGLSNIKGISNKDIKTILKDREENGLYKSFSDFLLRFIKNHCSFKTLENLINVGAFDSLEFTQGVDLGKLVFDNALNRISITEDDEIYNLRLLNKSNYLKGLIDGKFDIFDNVEDTLQAKYIKFFEIEEKTHLLPFIITKTLKTKESTIKKIFNGKTDNAKIKFVSDIEESYIAMEELKSLIVVPKDLDKEENKRAFFTKVGKLFEINKFTEKQIEDIEEIYQNKKSLIKTSNIEFEATGSLSNIGSILVKDYVFKDDFIVPKLNLLLNPFDIEGDFVYKVVAKDIIKGENDEGDLYLSLVVLDVNGMETRFYFNNDQISRFKNNIEEGDPLIIEVNVKEGKNTFYKKIVNIEVLKESDNWKKYDCFKPRPLNIKQLDQDKIRQDFAKVDFCDLEQLAIDWRNSLNGWKGLSPDANRTLCFILSNYRVGVSSKTGNPYQIVSISDGLDNKSIDLFYFDVAESDLKNNLNKPILVELAKRNEKYGLGAGYKTKIEFLGDGYLKEEKSTKKVEEETFLEILDGREHINVYSKGRTLLGRKLSNFADIPTMVEIDGETIKFKNVESLWFYLKIYLTFGEKDTNLLDMEGYEAKEYGSKRLKLSRPLTTEEREYFIDIMKKGIEWKIRNNEALREEFKANYKKIPYAHYYNYSGNIITLPEHQWLVDFLNELEV